MPDVKPESLGIPQLAEANDRTSKVHEHFSQPGTGPSIVPSASLTQVRLDSCLVCVRGKVEARGLKVAFFCEHGDDLGVLGLVCGEVDAPVRELNTGQGEVVGERGADGDDVLRARRRVCRVRTGQLN